MESEEPSARLVDTLGDEVGRVGCAVVDEFAVFKWVVYLGVWHGTRVEPHVYEVEFASEDIALVRDELDVVDIGAVEVYFVIVLL